MLHCVRSRFQIIRVPLSSIKAGFATTRLQESFKGRLIVEASKRNLPQSQWKLNFLVKLIRGKWVPDALAQLKFSPKHRAEDVAKIVRRAASLAKLHHNAIPEELVVKEVTVTKGMTHKRSRIMGKGRTGTGYARWAHVRVKVEKVDFQREIREAVNPILQKRWIRLSKQAYHARKLLTVSQESTPGTTPRS